MSLVALQTAIISAIDSGVSTFRTVEDHGGRYDLDEVKRIATKQPACLVSVLGGPVERMAGSTARCMADIVAAVVTMGSSQTGRDAAAAALAEAVAVLAIENAWEYEDAKAPERIFIDNLYSGALDRLGVALWFVRWKQLTVLGSFDASDYDDFNRLNVQTDMAPADGVVDDELDIWLQGTLMSAYGQIYVSADAATSIAVASTYQKAAGTTTLLRADGFDMPTSNRLRHTDDVTRAVSVQAKASISVDSDAEVFLAIAKNGTVVDESGISEDMLAADGAEVLAADALVELGENDYVEAWVTADDTVNVTLEKLTLVAVAT